MISTDQALEIVLALVKPGKTENIPLRLAAGRILASDIRAEHDQPPFSTSAMDGYGVHSGEAVEGAEFTVIGEAAAGSRFEGTVGAAQAVRIFTGAPVPKGVSQVILQEDTEQHKDIVKITNGGENRLFIRPPGEDIACGDGLEAGRKLSASDVAFLAAMNIANVPVRCKPAIAVLATGDELVVPGSAAGPDQIIASNIFGLAALFEAEGAEVRMLPLVQDNESALKTAFTLCVGADLIVTIGGSSVGDHDVVRNLLSQIGQDTGFHRLSMRPGKPLITGRVEGTPLIGLPGKPNASMVCGHILIRPAIQSMLGLPGHALDRELARTTTDLPKNRQSEHFIFARLSVENSQLTVGAPDNKANSNLSIMANANGFLVRPPNDPAKKIGDMVEVIRF